MDKSATPAQLKTAYRNLAKDYHPDVSSHPDAQARFVELSSAYEVRAIDDLGWIICSSPSFFVVLLAVASRTHLPQFQGVGLLYPSLQCGAHRAIRV